MTGSVVRVVFLISISLFLEKSGAQVLPLDMATNSVDDSYEGCKDVMNTLVISKFFAQDEKRLSSFKTDWEKARRNCSNSGLPLNQSTAIYLYTTDPHCPTDCSYQQFNSATRDGAAAYRSGDFQFYSLHFYLTDAVQQLKEKQNTCVTTYRRTNIKFKVFNQTIRFGSFTSTSFRKDLTGFGNESCFEIYTCFGAEVTNYSAFGDEQEVLIPPYEKFKVIGVKNSTWCNVVYELESVGKLSYLQCAKVNSSSSASLPFFLLPVLLLALLQI